MSVIAQVTEFVRHCMCDTLHAFIQYEYCNRSVVLGQQTFARDLHRATCVKIVQVYVFLKKTSKELVFFPDSRHMVAYFTSRRTRIATSSAQIPSLR